VPTSPQQLRAYARVALPAAQRLNLSLQRLSAQSGQTARVSRLLLDYQGLLLLYRRAAYAHGPASSSHLIRSAQQKVTTTARALHVPLCAPVPFSGL
jgi:hypothetical protein